MMDTVELERSLLHALIKSTHTCRQHVTSMKVEWFTSDEREFICETLLQTYRASRTTLSKTVYEYEVDKKIDDEEKTPYMSEWAIIENITVTEPPEALIERLKEAHVCRQMMNDIEKIVVTATEDGDIEKAISMYKRSAVSMNTGNIDQPIVELTDYKHRLSLIRDKQKHPEKYLGIKTGFPSFDKRTGGLFKQELTLIAGVTGLGKSTLVKALQKGIITENKNKNVLHIANEESQLQVETKFDALMTETPYLDFKLADISEEDLMEWVETMEAKLKKPGTGRIFIKEVPAFTDVSLVEQAYRELETKGIKIDVILIDHLPHIVPIEKAWGENDEKSKAAADCKQLAKDLDCAVVIPTQAATVVEEKQAKGRRAGKMDVHGSKAQVHVANTFIIITDKGKVPDDNLEEWQRDVNWLVDIKKNRDGPPFCFRARHYVQFGKVVEVFDDDEQEADEDHSANDEEAKAAEEALKELEKEQDNESGDNEVVDGDAEAAADDSADTATASAPDEVDSEPEPEPEKEQVVRKARSIKIPKSLRK